MSLLSAHDNLQYVEYIFVDEIPMVDCFSLYNICKRMCKALQKSDQPFGGINMIFAGDFAQLPTVVGGLPLYDSRVGAKIHTIHSYNEQKAIIGKVL